MFTGGCWMTASRNLRIPPPPQFPTHGSTPAGADKLRARPAPAECSVQAPTAQMRRQRPGSQEPTQGHSCREQCSADHSLSSYSQPRHLWVFQLLMHCSAGERPQASHLTILGPTSPYLCGHHSLHLLYLLEQSKESLSFGVFMKQTPHKPIPFPPCPPQCDPYSM